MHATTEKLPVSKDWRLRQLHAIRAQDGSCSAIYDVERTLVINVPRRLQQCVTNNLFSFDKPDGAMTRWLLSEDLLTREPRVLGTVRRPTIPTITDVSLDLAGTCNMACTYCFERQLPARFGPMSPDTLTTSVRFAFQLNRAAPGITFHFGSGEPLVRFDLVKKVVENSQELARSTGKQVSFELTTNGSLVTEEIAQFLGDNRFAVRVSCDGPARIHDRFRPMPGGRASYERVELGIALLLKHIGDRLTVNSVVCGETRLRELWRWAKQLGVRRYHVIKVGAANSSALRLRRRFLERFTSDTADICDDMYTELSRGRVPIDYQPISKILWRLMIPRPINRFCGAGSTYVGIAPNGMVYPCFRHLGLTAFELGDIWRGINETQRLLFLSQVAAHVDARPVCHACDARYLCGGGCYADSVCCTATPSNPVALHCDFWRAEIEAALRLFVRLTADAPSGLLRLFGCESHNLSGMDIESLSANADECG